VYLQEKSYKEIHKNYQMVILSELSIQKVRVLL